MINFIDVLLQENNKNVYQYESDIINCSKENLWNFLKNFNKYLKFNKIIKDFSIEGNFMIGTKFKVEFFNNENHQFIVSYIDDDINKKKWEFEITPLENNNFEKQAIRWCVIEISKEKCFIYVYHIFKEMLSYDIIKK